MRVTVENKTRHRLGAAIFQAADEEGDLRIMLVDLPFDVEKMAVLSVGEFCTSTIGLEAKKE